MQCSVIIGFTLGFLETDTDGPDQQPETATPATERIRTSEPEPFRNITGWLIFGNYAFQ